MLRACVAVVGVVTALAAGRAAACTCDGSGFAFVGAGVPRNAKLPVLGGFVAADEVRLLTAAGQEVPARLEAAPNGVFVVPEAPLEAHTPYRLEHRAAAFDFVTSAEVDLVAPGVPRIGAVTRAQGGGQFRSTCDLGGEDFRISVESGAPVDPFEVLEVYLGAHADGIDAGAPMLVVPHRDGFVLGNRLLCANNFPVSRVADLAVQVRTRDAAGNVSELSNAVQLKGGGCSTAGPGLGLACLALAFARGRRSERR